VGAHEFFSRGWGRVTGSSPAHGIKNGERGIGIEEVVESVADRVHNPLAFDCGVDGSKNRFVKTVRSEERDVELVETHEI
jgi:hypothetical protein